MATPSKRPGSTGSHSARPEGPDFVYSDNASGSHYVAQAKFYGGGSGESIQGRNYIPVVEHVLPKDLNFYGGVNLEFVQAELNFLTDDQEKYLGLKDALRSRKAKRPDADDPLSGPAIVAAKPEITVYFPTGFKVDPTTGTIIVNPDSAFAVRPNAVDAVMVGAAVTSGSLVDVPPLASPEPVALFDGSIRAVAWLPDPETRKLSLKRLGDENAELQDAYTEGRTGLILWRTIATWLWIAQLTGKNILLPLFDLLVKLQSWGVAAIVWLKFW